MAEEMRLVATVIDKFSPPLKAFRDRVKEIKAPGGLKEINAHFQEMHETIKKTNEVLKSGFGAALTGLGVGSISVAGAIAGITASVREFAGSATQLNAFNKATGISIQMLKELKAVSGIHGINAENIEGDLRNLAKNRDAIRRGQGNYSEVANMLGGGVQIAEDLRNTKDDQEYNEKVLRYIAQQKTAEARRALSNALTGSEDFAALGDSGIDKLNNERANSRKFLTEPSAIDKARAEEFQAAVGKMEASLDSLKEAIGTELAPVVSDMATSIANFTTANRGEVGEFFKKVAEALRSEDWKSDSEAIGAFFKTVMDFAKWVTNNGPTSDGKPRDGHDADHALNLPPEAINDGQYYKGGPFGAAVKKGSILFDRGDRLGTNLFGSPTPKDARDDGIAPPRDPSAVQKDIEKLIGHGSSPMNDEGLIHKSAFTYSGEQRGVVDAIAQGVEKGMRALFSSSTEPSALGGAAGIQTAAYHPDASPKSMLLGGAGRGSSRALHNGNVPDDGTSYPSSGRAPKEMASRAMQMMDRLVNLHHWTPEAAAIAAGNAQQESSIRGDGPMGDPSVPGGSWGAFQWNRKRLANLKAYAAKRGTNWKDTDVQTDFFAQEAEHMLPSWKNAHDLSHAGPIGKAYEGYGDNSTGTRVANAQRWLKYYQQKKKFESTAKAARDAGLDGNAPSANGKAQLDVHFHNAPKGLHTTTDGGTLFQQTNVTRGRSMAQAPEDV